MRILNNDDYSILENVPRLIPYEAEKKKESSKQLAHHTIIGIRLLTYSQSQ